MSSDNDAAICLRLFISLSAEESLLEILQNYCQANQNLISFHKITNKPAFCFGQETISVVDNYTF